MHSANDVWARIISMLNLPTVTLDSWFDEVKVLEIGDNRLVVHCPSDFKRGIIETRYLPMLKNALFELFAGEFDLLILGDDDLKSFMTNKHNEDDDRLYGVNGMTFANFVICDENKHAYASALAVAKNPATDFNPLYIHGSPGIGKTHLLHAIKHYVKASQSSFADKSIIIVEGKAFFSELVDAINKRKTDMFREIYHNASILLIDDVHGIKTESSQDELFDAFNKLYTTGGQLVFTSDKPPKELRNIHERMRSRFESGRVTEIEPLGLEARLAILKKKASQHGLVLSDDLLMYIADVLKITVRQLESAVTNIKADADVALSPGQEISKSFVEKSLRNLIRTSHNMPTTDIIIEETARFFNVSPEDIRKPGQKRDIVFPRQVSMFLIKQYFPNTSDETIGKEYKGKSSSGMHHTTVMSSIARVKELLEQDSHLESSIQDIRSNIDASVS